MNKEQYKQYRHNQRVWDRSEERKWSQEAEDYFRHIPLYTAYRYYGNFYRGNLVEFWKALHDPDNHIWGNESAEYKMREFKREMKSRY